MSLIPRVVSVAVLATSLLVSSGCGGIIECTSAPDEAIESFQVTIKTGDDATDADIYFCITRFSAAERDCTKLGLDLDDDFDEGATQDYTVTTAVDAGDLDGLWVENRGDAPDLSLDGDDWELEALRVVAQTASGSVEIVNADELALQVDAGEDFDPACSF
ncbi:MAG: hypothetical protein KDA24_25750 [Deltaproteobacteria bacterium]|nr:hypothetical protein [Deltaproteobacteria bacterium]